MIDTAEVMLWGTRVGILHHSSNISYISFEYDKDFLRSNINLSPIKMPLSDKVYSFPELIGGTFHGAPGLVADSLPDKFGNSIIERWLSEQGRSLEEFGVIDRLCYTGTRGMGALEYIPAVGPASKTDEPIIIQKMVDFASEILSSRNKINISREDSDYGQLLQLGTSAGGARAKALIAWNEKTQEIRSGQIEAENGFEYWLMKFDGVSKNGDHNLKDGTEYTLIEYAYYLMAKDSGIDMNECRLFEDNGFHHFMTKRFDRINNQKMHMQTLGAISHIDYNFPGLCSYEQASGLMRNMNISQKDIIQLYRRMIFNVMMVNQDDHVKNISFLMNRQGVWKLAPAYDITFSYNLNNMWLKAHQMMVNGKTEEITYSDLIESASKMNIKKNTAERIIDEIKDISDNLNIYFEKAGINEKTYNKIQKVISNVQKNLY
ncbi:MAG: HipA domain-containing protein [Lachnospiraceae bacterium]|nr:HipA domain-containing protein [Lachnospiraceae bacterium]